MGYWLQIAREIDPINGNDKLLNLNAKKWFSRYVY